MERGFEVRALGEVAIRCADLPGMSRFYGEILGLERMSGAYRDDIVFYRIGEGFAGHTTVLALFQAKAGELARGEASTLHHIALSLPRAEQEAVIAWFERHGLDYTIEEFGWIGWRGVFTRDPEGNTVELVAYDPSLLAAPSSEAK